MDIISVPSVSFLPGHPVTIQRDLPFVSSCSSPLLWPYILVVLLVSQLINDLTNWTAADREGDGEEERTGLMCLMMMMNIRGGIRKPSLPWKGKIENHQHPNIIEGEWILLQNQPPITRQDNPSVYILRAARHNLSIYGIFLHRSSLGCDWRTRNRTTWPVTSSQSVSQVFSMVRW